MNKNTFDLEKIYKELDKEFTRKGKAETPSIVGDYEINPTGLDGWMAYRYQFKAGERDLFGYAETIEEARANIISEQKVEGMI
jgi:hypothetical protein